MSSVYDRNLTHSMCVRTHRFFPEKKDKLKMKLNNFILLNYVIQDSTNSIACYKTNCSDMS